MEQGLPFTVDDILRKSKFQLEHHDRTLFHLPDLKLKDIGLDIDVFEIPDLDYHDGVDDRKLEGVDSDAISVSLASSHTESSENFPLDIWTLALEIHEEDKVAKAEGHGRLLSDK